jgi:hypothetical protein
MTRTPAEIPYDAMGEYPPMTAQPDVLHERLIALLARLDETTAGANAPAWLSSALVAQRKRA